MKFLYLFLSLFVISSAQAAELPPAIKATLKQGTISLRFETKAIGNDGELIGLHLSVIPKSRNLDIYQQRKLKPRRGSIGRDEIIDADTLQLSPFTLELFEKTRGVWNRVNAVAFEQNKDVQRVETRWLDPKRKIGPVLLLHFGYSEWHQWEVFTFPQGIENLAKHQTFHWSTEGEDNNSGLKFDRTDAAGKMVISEKELEGPAEWDTKNLNVKHWIYNNVYHFNGSDWVNLEARYFVIAKSFKTRVKAEKTLADYGLGEVISTSKYTLLPPNQYALVLRRYSDLKRAKRWADIFRVTSDSMIKPYVIKAY